MYPSRAHYDIGFRLVGKGLCDSPDVVGKVGSAIDEVVCEEERDRIDEHGGHSGRE